MRPQRGHGGAPVGLQRRVDARMRRAGQPDLVLQPPIVAIGVRRGRGHRHGNEAELARDPQQRDVAQVARQHRVVVRVREDEVLDRELDVDHAARIVLEVEQRRRVRVAGEHPAPHVDDVGRELSALARQAQNRVALGLEGGADRGVAGDEPRAGERLMLPRPRLLALVAAEAGERRRHQALGAIGAQPEIDVVERAGGRHAGEPGDEAPREPQIALLSRVVGVVVEEDEVEVGRVAQLLAAELAETDDRELRRRRLRGPASASTPRRGSPRG